MNKFALVLIGHSFRTGLQGARVVGNEDAYRPQKDASMSQLDFVKHIKSQHNYDCDICVCSVSTRYDNELISWYGDKLADKILINYRDSHSLQIHVDNGIRLIQNKTLYDFIFFMRIDLHLKSFMRKVFNPFSVEKITFPSICFIPHHKFKESPRVNDAMMMIPRKYYDLLGSIKLNHETWHDMRRKTWRGMFRKSLNHSDFDTLLDTYHDSDSYKDWNPLYFISGREKCLVWTSKGYVFNKITREPEKTSNEHMYDDFSCSI